jgi:hypothetical protein
MASCGSPAAACSSLPSWSSTGAQTARGWRMSLLPLRGWAAWLVSAWAAALDRRFYRGSGVGFCMMRAGLAGGCGASDRNGRVGDSPLPRIGVWKRTHAVDGRFGSYRAIAVVQCCCHECRKQTSILRGSRVRRSCCR